MLTIGFISLGCSKNLVDSQVMAGYIIKAGMKLAPSPDQADVILVNTCGFIEPARLEATESILSACQHKANGGCKAVIVTGCMAQRYREQMIDTFPDVDAFLGVDALDQIATTIQTIVDASKKPRKGKASQRKTTKTPLSPPPVLVAPGDPVRLFNPPIPGLRFTGPAFGYLKVSEGCNHACSFCAIPQFRGKLRSRSINDLLYEADKLISTGAKEINIIAQDVTIYGRDIKNGPNLATLLRKLDQCEGDFWLRILYGFPNHVTDELLEVIANSRHVAHYLDLPIQHAHPDILRAMYRADTIASMPTWTAHLRKAIPDVTLRTTCMVGFPGETDEHFQFLYDYVKEAKFDHLGTFIFSPEELTVAADLPGLPAPEVAQARYDALMTLQKGIAKRRNHARIGQIAQALVLDYDDGEGAIARLAHQAPDVDGETYIDHVPDSVHAGDFVQVKITGVQDYNLTAKLV